MSTASPILAKLLILSIFSIERPQIGGVMVAAGTIPQSPDTDNLTGDLSPARLKGVLFCVQYVQKKNARAT
jgi:hypothetical protein